MAPNQASVFAENEALKQTLVAMQEGAQQRASVIFFMFLEGLELVASAARQGDPGAKQICRRVSDVLEGTRALASGIVVVK